MTLAGTRPPLIGEVSEYELHHRARLAIKPGITGMWQVSGRSDITDFEEVVELDKEYIENWNIGLDIKILLYKAMMNLYVKYDNQEKILSALCGLELLLSLIWLGMYKYNIRF